MAFKAGDKVKIVGPKTGNSGFYPGWDDGTDVFIGKMGYIFRWNESNLTTSDGDYAVSPYKDCPAGELTPWDDNKGYYGHYVASSLELVAEEPIYKAGDYVRIKTSIRSCTNSRTGDICKIKEAIDADGGIRIYNAEESDFGYLHLEEIEPAERQEEQMGYTFKHGDYVTCDIESVHIYDARISFNADGKMFICQNEKSGSTAEDTLGYKYSWTLGRNLRETSASAINTNTCNVRNIQLISKGETTMSEVTNDPVTAILESELDADTRLLRQIGFEDEQGKVTDTGKKAILNSIYRERRADFANKYRQALATEEAAAKTATPAK